MFEQLQDVERRFEELTARMGDPDFGKVDSATRAKLNTFYLSGQTP